MFFHDVACFNVAAVARGAKLGLIVSSSFSKSYALLSNVVVEQQGMLQYWHVSDRILAIG
jgi:hypothetical protein